MTANELIDSAKEIHTTIEALEFVQKAIPLLREQQAEIESLKKELALQRLSDIGQAIEFNEDTESYVVGQAIQRELTNDEIMEICDEVGRDLTRWGYFQVEFAREILKKTSEK